MGALMLERKRRHYLCTSNCKSPAFSSPSSDSYPSKKRNVLSSLEHVHGCPRMENKVTAGSRLRQYPDSKPQLKRVPHVPVRSYIFGTFVNTRSRELGTDSTNGNDVTSEKTTELKRKLDKTREEALRSLRYVINDNEVVEAKDNEIVEVKDDEIVEVEDDEIVEVVNVEEKEPSGDSGIEEDGILANARDQGWYWERNNKDVDNLKTSDGTGKVVFADFRPSSSYFLTNVSTENLRMESPEKMDSLSLGGERDYMELNAYKKLVSSVVKIDQTLDTIRFQIEFHEKMRETLQLSRPRKKIEAEAESESEAKAKTFMKKMVDEAFNPLTKDELNQVNHAFSRSQRRKLVVAHESSNIDITGELLQCLKPGMWLNDEVINLYLELLKEREKREPQKFLKCHFFSTFFYKKLTSGEGGYNFQSVRRWTSHRKLGYFIYDCDKIFVPIHKKVHWCLAVINKEEEKFQYLDSLGGADARVLKNLARYFADEVKEKSGKEIDVSSWKQEFVEDLPKQINGYDCGVFMVKYADFYSRGIGLCFNQTHMPYFRRRTAKEILKLKAE